MPHAKERKCCFLFVNRRMPRSSLQRANDDVNLSEIPGRHRLQSDSPEEVAGRCRVAITAGVRLEFVAASEATQTGSEQANVTNAEDLDGVAGFSRDTCGARDEWVLGRWSANADGIVA